MEKLDLASAIDAAILPHLPRDRIKARYAQAPGNELRDKFVSPESSAALAANAFGLFLENPGLLKGLPLAEAVEVELEAPLRFPWSGGRHPYLDVLVVGTDALVGVESKRFEPFRPHPPARMSAAYRRPVWGDSMEGYEAIRDRLYSDPQTFKCLDAAQLIKHALGLRNEVHRRQPNGYAGRRPVLVYLYATPTRWPQVSKRSISAGLHSRHADEIRSFAEAVSGDEVAFHALTYEELLTSWSASDSQALQDHVRSLRVHFLI